MRFMFFILVFSVIINCSAVTAVAVINEGTSTDEAISTVIYQRQRAEEEYEQYEYKKHAEAVAVAPEVSSVIIKKDTTYSNAKNDIILSIALLLVAIALTIYLYRFSKKGEGTKE